MAKLDTYERSGFVGSEVRRLAGVDWVYNVLTYGAVGDGATNDLAAINAAMAAASAAGGGVVYFPEGTYAIDGLITAPSGVELRGVRAKSVIKTIWTSSVSVQLIACTNVTNVSFVDLVFDGNQSILSNFLNCVQLFNSQNIAFHRCRFQTMKGIALLASTNTQSLRVTHCEFVNCGVYPTFGPGGGRQAIAFSETVAANSYDNVVANCTFNNIGLDAVSASRQQRFVAVGNQFTQIGGAALYLSGTQYAVLTANVARTGGTGASPYANGIDCFQASHVSVTGNVMYECGGAGIGIFGCNGAVVAGNYCVNNNQDAASVHRGGIVVNTASSNVVVEGNVCTDTQSPKTQQYGLVVDPTCTNITVGIGNMFQGNLDGDISSTDYASNSATETAVTYVSPYYSTGGVTPGIEARGTAADIDVQLKPKGAGAVDIANGALEMAGTAVINSSRHPVLRSYAKASLPSATVAAQFIYVTDDAGGATPAFSDGTNWRRVADRAVIS